MQLHNTHKPEGNSQNVNNDSARLVIEDALKRVESGDVVAVWESSVIDALKQVRGTFENEYCAYEQRFKAGFKTHGVTGLQKLNKLTKVYKQSGTDDDANNQRKELKLAELAKQKAEFFADSDGECWMRCKVANTADEQGVSDGYHLETYKIKSDAFRDWCEINYFLEYADGVGDSAMKNTIDMLRPFAKHLGEQHEVYLRYAFFEGAVYIDMVDDKWRVIKVDASGWETLSSDDSPVRFTREDHMRALPEPSRDGDLNLLWEALPVTNEDDRRMLIVYIINTMLVDSDYLMLELGGVAGAVKSGTQVVLRSILDPSTASLIDYSGKLDDVPVMAKKSYIVGFENMSYLSKQLQNRFCRMLTGGTMATRDLHTTDNLKVWSIKTPIVINGIEELVTEPDLMQRTFSLEMPVSEIWKSKKLIIKKWEKLRPRVLGGLYDLLARTLAERERSTITESKETRQVDLLIDGQAVFDALGFDEPFESRIKAMQLKAALRNVDSCPVTRAIVDLVDDEKVNISYTMTDLLDRLDNVYRPKCDPKQWVNSVYQLRHVIKKQTDTLKKLNILISRTRSNGVRKIQFEKLPD